VTPDAIAVVRGELEAFATEVFEPFARKDQRRWGQVYLRGLLTDGQRKSVEPMAARLGEDGNRQALANFITTSPWDPAHIRARLAWRMEEAIGPEALVFDDTGFLKDGSASACVSRQYRHGAGLSLYQVVRELQTLLALWTGACPTCHRYIPTPIRT
jgi:SRSO17 transposase